jgi:methionyl-tRNA formyltransferase
MNIVFAGTPEVAAVVLRRLAKHHRVVLAITREDAKAGRGKELRPSPVAQAASELGIPVLKTNRLAESEMQIVDSSEANIAVVVAFGALIPEAARRVLKWWNLHFSVLPAWRGAAPLQHSLIHQGGQGLTVFEIDDDLDTGPVISSQNLKLPPDKPAGELLLELANLGSDLLLGSLERMPAPTPQAGDASRAPKISRNDSRLDFSLFAMELQRRIYAFNPEPMAWCQVGDSEMRILKARAIGDVDWNRFSEAKLEPGTLERRKDSILVACGEGSRLELLLVQPAGKKPMRAVDWARGYQGTLIG